MGLAVEVGLVAYQVENGGVDDQLNAEFERLSEFLVANGLKRHDEPEICEVVSFGMYGYAGLHYLRRVAAYLDLDGTIPEPGGVGGAEPADDPILQRYYDAVESNAEGRTFDHLIVHSDAEGFYVPQEFPNVLAEPTGELVAGGFVGSSQRLKEECIRLALVLELPLDTDPEDESVYDAADNQGNGDLKWQRYGVESFTLLRLYNAAKHSIETGAAIMFC